MATPLETLLDRLDPAECIDPIERTFYAKTPEFPLPAAMPQTWDELQKLLSHFAFHISPARAHESLWHLRDDSFFHEDTIRVMSSRLGGEDWLDTALFRVRTGSHGGLRGLFNEIMAIECRRQVDLHILFHLVEPFYDRYCREPSALFTFEEEYFRLVSPLIPNDAVLQIRARVSISNAFRRALCGHPYLIREHGGGVRASGAKSHQK